MAAKLQVRLTFQGGEDMKRVLKELGVEGQKSFGGLRTAAGSVGVALKAVGDIAKTIVKSVAVTAGAIGAAGAAVTALAKSSAEAADQAGKMAQKVGINAQAYQRLAYAAKLADVEQEALKIGLIQLNKAIAAGDPKKLAIFGALGINLRDAAGNLKGADRVLLDLADVFNRAPDGAAKTAVAVQLLGEAGANLIPLLNDGGAAISALGEEADRLGLVFTDKAIAASQVFNDTLTTLSGAITGVKNAIGQLFIPELTRLAQLLTDFIVRNREQIVAWVKEGWDFVVQVVKDLVALFQGREADVANTWILTARDNLLLTLDAALAVGRAIMGIVDGFAAIGAFVSAPFRGLGAAGDALSALGPSNKLNVPGFARGGRVWGPGNGTSDSILARLSRGEFVIRSAVVDKLGAPFFSALNAGAIPAFAEGGAVGGGRPINVTIGAESFAMTAADDVAESLIRHSQKRALRTPGRLPSWATKR